MKDEKEFRAAARHLLELVDAEARGEISQHELLRAWKIFMRAGNDYLKQLERQIKLN